MIINYDLSAASPSTPSRPSAPAARCQQLYLDGKFVELLAQVDSCLPKDAAGNFVVEQERSDVLHDLLAFLAEKMLEMNKQKLARRSGSWRRATANSSSTFFIDPTSRR